MAACRKKSAKSSGLPATLIQQRRSAETVRAHEGQALVRRPEAAPRLKEGCPRRAAGSSLSRARFLTSALGSVATMADDRGEPGALTPLRVPDMPADIDAAADIDASWCRGVCRRPGSL